MTLGARPANGFRAGAFTTDVSLLPRYAPPAPDTCILRAGFSMSQTVSTPGVDVHEIRHLQHHGWVLDGAREPRQLLDIA